MSDPKDSISAAAHRARGVISDTAETVKDTVNRAEGQALQYGREAGQQLGAAADAISGPSNDIIETVADTIRRNPWSTVAVAALLGYWVARFR